MDLFQRLLDASDTGQQMLLLFENMTKDDGVPIVVLFREVLKGGLERAIFLPTIIDEHKEVGMSKPRCKKLKMLGFSALHVTPPNINQERSMIRLNFRQVLH